MRVQSFLTIPNEYKTRQNPQGPTAQNQLDGRTRYESYCAICHGADGRSQTPLGQSLYPPAADLTRPATQNYSDGQLFWMISEGVRYSGMPAFRTLQSEANMWNLVLYIRTLKR